MSFGTTPASRLALAAILGFSAFFAANPLLKSASAPAEQRQNIHSIIAQAKLSPPVRSPEVSLRYSPDGNYLLLQDPAGVAVLLRNPLRILLHISADNIYPVEFSRDSQSLVLVSRGLSFAKWRLPDGEKIANGNLPGQEECSDGRLSPGGEFFACLKPDLHFVLFDISAAKNVFEESLSPPLPPGPGGLRSFYPANLLYFSSIDFDSAFPGPFGLIRTNGPESNPNGRLYYSSIHFSPDGKVLLARAPKGYFGLDIAAKKSFEPHGAVQRVAGAIALPTSDRVIAAENGKDFPSSKNATVLSLYNGDTLANLSLSAGRLQMATNPRYVLQYNFSADGQNCAAFGLEQNRALDIPPAVALDVRADEFAVYTPNGSIALYRIGERNLLANLPMPLPSLPSLRGASVTPNLDKVAFSVNGIGVIFDLATGQRVATLPKFSAVNFLDQGQASLLFPRFDEDPTHVSRVDLSAGTLSPSWQVEKDHLLLRSGGAVLLHYSPLKNMRMAAGDFPEMGMGPPYTLRALDPATGKELWKREFKDNPPVPFADPQGERLVLGWKAKSSEAKSAASHSPAAREILKNAKVTDHDTYFEVLEARSGNSDGGVLVMAGNGAASFDAAFSVGDMLILQKDSTRVSLYSLLDGQLKARLVGLRPSAAVETRLLALDMGEGRLGVFDLNTGTKLDEQIFPEAIAYTHFSADGKRVFALTEHQTAVILDVSKVRGEQAAAPPTSED